MSAGKVVNLKVTVVNHSKKYRKRSLVYSIILLVLGIFLTFNSSGVPSLTLLEKRNFINADKIWLFL